MARSGRRSWPGGNDRYRAIVEPLADEFDLVDIALAAIAQADSEARGAVDTTELAPAMLPSTFPQRPGGPRGAGRRPPFHAEHGAVHPPRPRPAAPGVPFAGSQGRATGPVGERADAGIDGDGTGQPAAARPAYAGPRSALARTVAPAGPRRGYRPSGWQTPDGRPVMRAPARGSGGGGVTRLFVGLGRAGGVRPGDLVGAITHEAGLDGRDIGAIQIADGFSLVEVPEAAAEHVIGVLRGATIRGQKVMVRRERY